MEPNDAASSSARAHELRASLGTRREVEALLAEASATREAAVADADAMVEEAQEVSEQLLRESRNEAERATTDARLRAEGVVGRARTEAEDITRQARAAADAVRARAESQVEEHRKRVRAELTEQVNREVAEHSRRELARVHERQQAMIGDIEASVRILGVSMEAAVSNISEMLGALDSLRAHTAESLGDASPMNAPPRHADDSDDGNDTAPAESEVATDPATTDDLDDLAHVGEPVESDEAETVDTHVDGDHGESDEVSGQEQDAAPVAKSSRSGHLIDALADLDGSADAGAVGRDEHDEDDDQPLTATEAFLRSAHVDHGDPPLPPMDDDEVGNRYARDAMRATARGRARRDKETLEVLPERSSAHRPGRNGKTVPDERAAVDGTDDGDGSGKPLGWLFRSSQ